MSLRAVVNGPNRVATPDPSTTELEWFTAARKPLQEINSRLLDLMALVSGKPSRAAFPLALELRDIFSGLDFAARERAASCPYLLVDAGFQDAIRWASAAVELEPVVGAAGSFPGKEALELSHMTLTFAWSLVRSHREGANLLLGLSPACSKIIAELRLQELQHIAANHFDWIRPRWESRPEVWRRLLAAAKDANALPLNSLGLQGLHLFFGDLLT
jgi:hypothetical protein